MEEIRIAIAIIGTGIACYYDIFNRKNIPEKFLYIFLLISILINIFDYSLLLKTWIIAIPLILLLFALYKIGQIGGADVFVLASIYFLIPTKRQEAMGALLISEIPSIIPILAFSSILFLIFLFFKYIGTCVKNLKKVKEISILQVIILIGIFSFLFYTLKGIIEIKFIAFNLFILFFLSFLILFKDIISEEMIEMKRVNEIESEEVLAIEKIDEKIVRKLSLKRLIDENQLNRMKKEKRIKKWPIFNLPQFLPFIFIGLIIYLIIGDPILFFISL